MREHDCYRVLKIPPSASYAEIQNSYRRLVKLYHPDLSGRSADGARLARVVDAFRTLQIARAPEKPEGGGPSAYAGGRGSGAGMSLSDLGRLAAHGGSPETRAFAVRRLANTGRRSVYGWIRPALFDPSPTVVGAAVEAIARLRVLQSAGELAVVFARGDESTRLRILDAVRKMSDLRPFRSMILSGMQDSDAEVRRMALRLFRRMKRSEVFHQAERRSG
jgi:hypothetical protein